MVFAATQTKRLPLVSNRNKYTPDYTFPARASLESLASFPTDADWAERLRRTLASKNPLKDKSATKMVTVQGRISFARAHRDNAFVRTIGTATKRVAPRQQSDESQQGSKDDLSPNSTASRSWRASSVVRESTRRQLPALSSKEPLVATAAVTAEPFPEDSERSLVQLTAFVQEKLLSLTPPNRSPVTFALSLSVSGAALADIFRWQPELQREDFAAHDRELQQLLSLSGQDSGPSFSEEYRLRLEEQAGHFFVDLLQLASVCKVDLREMFCRKLTKNLRRYPLKTEDTSEGLEAPPPSAATNNTLDSSLSEIPKEDPSLSSLGYSSDRKLNDFGQLVHGRRAVRTKDVKRRAMPRIQRSLLNTEYYTLQRSTSSNNPEQNSTSQNTLNSLTESVDSRQLSISTNGSAGIRMHRTRSHASNAGGKKSPLIPQCKKRSGKLASRTLSSVGDSSLDEKVAEVKAAISISEMQSQLIEFNTRRGWREFHSPRNALLCLIGRAGEVARVVHTSFRSIGTKEHKEAPMGRRAIPPCEGEWQMLPDGQWLFSEGALKDATNSSSCVCNRAHVDGTDGACPMHEPGEINSPRAFDNEAKKLDPCVTPRGTCVSGYGEDVLGRGWQRNDLRNEITDVFIALLIFSDSVGLDLAECVWNLRQFETRPRNSRDTESEAGGPWHSGGPFAFMGVEFLSDCQTDSDITGFQSQMSEL